MTDLKVYGALQGNILSMGYKDRVLNFARTCDTLGFTGALLHYNHRTFDPWQLAALLLNKTDSFTPMIAVQPYSAPPFTVAKMIATIAYFYGRRVDLNLISGSSSGELNDIGEPLSHTQRYERLVEYAAVVSGLLRLEDPDEDLLTFDGRYYNYEELHYFSAGMPEHLIPRYYLAGSSAVGKWAAAETGSCLLTNPEPLGRFLDHHAGSVDDAAQFGVRFGIIARDTAEEAWKVARNYFPHDEAGLAKELTYGRGSDSHWRRTISELAVRERYDDVYWLGPTRASRSYSPFLVGCHKDVADYLNGYVEAGVSTLILASPWEEYASNAEVFSMLPKTALA